MMFSTQGFLLSTLSSSVFALNFKPAFTLSFSGKSPPEWISSHLLNQALLSLLASLICIRNLSSNLFTDKHVSTQMYVEHNQAKQKMKKHESAQLSAVAIWLCCQATADSFELYVGRPRFDRPERSSRDSHVMPRKKFINLATRGIIKFF